MLAVELVRVFSTYTFSLFFLEPAILANEETHYVKFIPYLNSLPNYIFKNKKKLDKISSLKNIFLPCYSSYCVAEVI